jgi:hypothetical protein
MVALMCMLPQQMQVHRGYDYAGHEQLHRRAPGTTSLPYAVCCLCCARVQPVLLVGNHQLFAPDMPPMVAQFLKVGSQGENKPADDRTVTALAIKLS